MCICIGENFLFFFFDIYLHYIQYDSLNICSNILIIDIFLRSTILKQSIILVLIYSKLFDEQNFSHIRNRYIISKYPKFSFKSQSIKFICAKFYLQNPMNFLFILQIYISHINFFELLRIPETL